jgi:RimJ/RimL family protein N-acetyltransferase
MGRLIEAEKRMPAIRTATPNDLAFIAAIERLPGFEALMGHCDLAWRRAQLANPGVAYLIAEAENQGPVGFAALQHLDDAHGNVLLQSIAVKVPGGGIGTCLVHAAMRFAFTRPSAHRLWLTVLRHNSRALAVFQSCGLVQEGMLRESFRYPDGCRVAQVLLSILRSEWDALPASAAGPDWDQATMVGSACFAGTRNLPSSPVWR